MKDNALIDLIQRYADEGFDVTFSRAAVNCYGVKLSGSVRDKSVNLFKNQFNKDGILDALVFLRKDFLK